MEEIQYISIQRKGENLVSNNYCLRIYKTIKNKKYWKCIENGGARLMISNLFIVHSDKFCYLS